MKNIKNSSYSFQFCKVHLEGEAYIEGAWLSRLLDIRSMIISRQLVEDMIGNVVSNMKQTGSNWNRHETD